MCSLTPKVEALMFLEIEIEQEQEEDGRWIAEVVELPGVMAYGATQGEAKAKTKRSEIRRSQRKRSQGEAK